MDLVLETAAQVERGLTRVTVRAGVTFLVIQAASLREHQSGVIETQLRELEEQTSGRVALCLSEVEDMSSAFINVLLESDGRCRELGGRLVLFGLNHELGGLFRATGMFKRLCVVRDCNQALRRVQRLEPRRFASFWSWLYRQAA